jgi:hypothetical protein
MSFDELCFSILLEVVLSFRWFFGLGSSHIKSSYTGIYNHIFYLSETTVDELSLFATLIMIYFF